MTTALSGAVELLDRALAYTRVVLARVGDDDLARPTPCASWDLGALLVHMEDGLDAFTEAAGGSVGRGGPLLPGARPRVDRLQQKACALLGTWSASTPVGVDVAGHGVATDLLVRTAALEITVHGWDVARALDGDHAVPDDLATRLLEEATLLVHPEDRAVRFAPARPAPPGAGPSARLLGFLGRG